jgi:hypothetical protein
MVQPADSFFVGGAEMAVAKGLWCRLCAKNRRHERQESMSEGFGCLLIILTGGLFLLVYAPYKLWVMMFPTYRCGDCGTARGR